MRKSSLIRYFYEAGQRSLELHAEAAHRLLRSAQFPLAELRHKNPILMATDKQGTVLRAGSGLLAYTPYGHALAVCGQCSSLGFNQQPRDRFTQLYLLGNGYRAFNCVLMRFNSPDSWSPFGDGGFNSYAYCSADPINLIDESGHVPRWLAMNRLPAAAFHQDPFHNHPNWAQYPNISKRSQKHFAKLPNRINKAIKTATTIDLNPALYPQDSLTYRTFERRMDKIQRSYNLLDAHHPLSPEQLIGNEAARVSKLTSYAQRHNLTMMPTYTEVAQTLSLQLQSLKAPPAYELAIQNPPSYEHTLTTPPEYAQATQMAHIRGSN